MDEKVIEEVVLSIRTKNLIPKNHSKSVEWTFFQVKNRRRRSLILENKEEPVREELWTPTEQTQCRLRHPRPSHVVVKWVSV